jgi:putative glutamine amidotransferase
MAPVVLITGEEGIDSMAGSPHFVLSKLYPRAAAKAGALALMPQDVRRVPEYTLLADALILTEGPPIHRGRYGKFYTDYQGMMALSPTRDDFEFTLLRSFLEAKKPVLGLGRGMNIINTALGGVLRDDPQPTSGAAAGNTTETKAAAGAAVLSQGVIVQGNTRLGAAFPSLPAAAEAGGTVIEDLPGDLRIWAESAEGTIEGIEHRELRVFGIRWHPEWQDFILGDLFNLFISQSGGKP